MRGKIVHAPDGTTKYFVNGKEVSKKQFFRTFKPQPMGSGAGLIAWHRPIHSDALAVHPDQIEEAMAMDKAHGVPTEYLPDGRPVLVDRDHRRRLMRSLGVHDNDGGYGDG